MNTVIRRYVFEAELSGTEADGMALQRLLARLTQDKVLSVVEQVLDACSPTQGHLYLEKLVIDAGPIDMMRLEQDLPGKIADGLKNALNSYEISNVMQIPAADSAAVQHKPDRQVAEDALLFFLKTGRLPWSYRLPQSSNLEQVLFEAWRDNGPEGQSRIFKSSLIATLNDNAARIRLVSQFSPVFNESLLLLLSPDAEEAIHGIHRRFSETAASAAEKESYVGQLFEAGYAALASGQQPDLNALFSQEMKRLLSLGSVNDPDSRNHTMQSDRRSECPAAAIDADAETNQPPSQGLSEDTGSPGGQKRRRQPFADDIENAEGVYIDNAGLVLLHPFLPHLFSTLGLVNEDKIIKFGRALAVLHYLATGAFRAHEYELVLPKVLCGIDLPAPVEALSALSAGERGEADAMLAAVVKHWAVLRNTAIDGLRGTFLLRPGKLSLRSDGDWRVQVEQRTCDILLNSLPWGIGTIKLPWMRALLWVEWDNENQR